MNSNSDSRTMVFADQASVGNFNERGAKQFADYYGSCVQKNGLAICSVYGALGNGSFESHWSTYTDIESEVEQLVCNDKVNAIALVINSPGGMCAGMFECCDYIKKASQTKPIYAYIDGMACSAAYALATSCTKVYMAQDAETGCCGCYAQATEVSEKAYESMGVLKRIFRSKCSPRKNQSIITNEEEAKAYQEQVDKIGEKYISYVAENRGVEKADALLKFGQGAVVDADYALANSMVDAVGSFEECIKNLISSLPSEGEGENMDIKSMSAEELVGAMSDEQKQALATQLCASNPSLTEEEKSEVRKAERDRLNGLNALRNGSEAINALVDAAVEDGREAKDIACDVVKAMQAEAPIKATNEEAGRQVLESFVANTETVNVPSAAKTEEQIIEMLTAN